VTSRVTAVLALVAVVAIGPLALSSSARLRAASRSAPAASDLPLEPAASTIADAARALGSTGAAPRRHPPRRFFRVAHVRRAAALRSGPRGRVLARVGGRTEFGSPVVLGVAGRRGRWLGVVAAGLPNGKLGWVRRDDSSLNVARTRYALHADLSARRLELRRSGRRIARFPVAVGRRGSATPTGRFAITDKLPGSRFGPYYGCCILALSGHQPNTPPGWRGGDRLAIHGKNGPGGIGQASSAGCLRASDRALRVLMRRVPQGTPVFIRP